MILFRLFLENFIYVMCLFTLHLTFGVDMFENNKVQQ